MPPESKLPLGDRSGGTPHDHSTYVEGCFRCELSRDEANDGFREEVTYLNCGGGAYMVFARDDGRLLGDVVRSGRKWWAGPHRYATRREAGEMMLDRDLAHTVPAEAR